MGNKPTIAVTHLGCEKNRIDTEHMLGLLVQAGYEVDANEELADYVIVNTCSFIQAAREESVRALVELAEADKKIVITGCMAQHFQSSFWKNCQKPWRWLVQAITTRLSMSLSGLKRASVSRRFLKSQPTLQMKRPLVIAQRLRALLI
jgi:tRNA A37 methylthiotransferase MiaB